MKSSRKGNPAINNFGKKFSKENQPKNRRKSKKLMTDALIQLITIPKKEVIIDGVDLESGEMRKFKVVVPDSKDIIDALVNKAISGDVSAMREIFDRIEGKPTFTADVNLNGIQRIGFD